MKPLTPEQSRLVEVHQALWNIRAWILSGDSEGVLKATGNITEGIRKTLGARRQLCVRCGTVQLIFDDERGCTKCLPDKLITDDSFDVLEYDPYASIRNLKGALEDSGIGAAVSDTPSEPKTFEKALEHAVNCFSKESGSNTPDFILAGFLADTLKAFDKAYQARSRWYKDDAGEITTPPFNGPTTPPPVPLS